MPSKRPQRTPTKQSLPLQSVSKKRAKPIPPARSEASKVFAIGSKLAGKSKFADAVAALREAVNRDPGNLLYRKVLRATECQKYRNNGIGSTGDTHGAFVRLMVEITDALKSRNFGKLDQCAEDGLAINPWHVEMHVALARAAAGLGYTEVARFAAETAASIAPGRADVVGLAKELGL